MIKQDFLKLNKDIQVVVIYININMMINYHNQNVEKQYLIQNKILDQHQKELLKKNIQFQMQLKILQIKSDHSEEFQNFTLFGSDGTQ